MTAHIHRLPSRAMQCCGNCDAYVPNPQQPLKGPRAGSCCASPPALIQTVQIVPGSQLAPGGPQTMPVWQGAFAPTTETGWCRGWAYKDTEDDRFEDGTA
jgi:hypothetical protein